MPQIKNTTANANNLIQVEYEIEIEVETEQETDVFSFTQGPISLINKELFVERFIEKHGDLLSRYEIAQFWHCLFGNYDAGNVILDDEGLNPNFHYLTSSSCDEILNHFHLFKNGIDFEHLPSGFIAIKNPLNGQLDVIDFSEPYKKFHHVSPLAITLNEKVAFSAVNKFNGHQKDWYDFFISKAPSYCSEEELRCAFISFSNRIQQLNLEFYAPDFSLLDKECNPIILLGRMETVMSNPALRKDDQDIQWQHLLQLPLVDSDKAIRAITDFQYTNTPCTFVLPEMGFDIYPFNKTKSVVYSMPQETQLNYLWRTLAYEKERLPLAFYKHAWELIEPLMDFDESHPLSDAERMQKQCLPKFFSIILFSTIRSNYFSSTKELEDKETFRLDELIQRYKNIDSFLSKRIDAALGRGFLIEALTGNNFHQGTIQSPPAELEIMINRGELPFAIIHKYFLSAIELFSANIFQLLSRLIKFEEIVMQLKPLFDKYDNDYEPSMHLYFDDLTHTIFSYHTLLAYLDKKIEEAPRAHQELSKHLIALFSCFSLHELNDIDNALHLLSNVKNQERLQYVFKLFRDMEHQLPAERFSFLINLIDNLPAETTEEEMLTCLEQEFASSFPVDYFAIKKENLRNLNLGLSPVIETSLTLCRFAPDDFNTLLKLELNLLQAQPQLPLATFEQLNEHLRVLKGVILPSEFSKLVKEIATIPNLDINELDSLVSYMVDIRSTADFMQIMVCNHREQCQTHLPDRIEFFIRAIKPLTRPLKLTVNDKALFQEALATVILNTDWTQPGCKQLCLETAQILISNAESILTNHPSVKHHLFTTLSHLSRKTDQIDYLLSVQYFIEIQAHISTLLSTNSRDKLVYFSLLAHFTSEPLFLTNIVQRMESAALSEEKQYWLLTLISQLKDSNQSLDGINLLIDSLKDDSHFQTLLTNCPTPPFPEVNKMTDWLTGGQFAEAYRDFSLQPFGERNLNYAFDIKHFKRQVSKFSFMEKEVNPFNAEPNLSHQLNELAVANRSKTVIELREEFTQLKTNLPLNAEQDNQLMMLCVEMLARTTSQQQPGSDVLISQGFNTTQIMALWTMIKHNSPKLLAEIDTGEGKSRITMILAAFFAAKQKTVDVITSDLALSERDFLAYRSFFTALDIPTSLIDLDTPFSLYQKQGGVNFSDNSRLLLLRNKSDITLSPFDYLDEQEENRILITDEADEFIHDKSKDSYNFATKSKTLSQFVWIYPKLVDFMEQKQNAKHPIVVNNILLNEFLLYVENNDIDPSHLDGLARLEKTNPELLYTWLRSADKALRMQVNRDYKITSAALDKRVALRGSDGHIHYSRQILVLKNGRPAIGSTFANGVHQCLCALENKRTQCDNFLIQAENEVQRASYPINFINKYEKGRVIGVSGTTRSDAPKANKAINYQNYQYVKVPRHLALKRTDNCIWQANDESQQIQFLKYELLKSLRAKPAQPTLIICKDDKQSELLANYLKTDKMLMQLMNKLDSQIQRVEGLSDKAFEINAINNAGTKGTITLSTVGMFGRGVDIHAENLSVIAMYVPTLEDEKQIKGRTARFGEIGQYRLIPNINDPDCIIKGRSYDARHPVRNAQNQQAFSAVFQESIANLYAEFLEEVTYAFLDNLKIKQHSTGDSEDYLLHWQTFLNAMQKDWSDQSQSFIEAFESNNEENFKENFKKFTEHWLNELNEQLQINFQFSNNKINTIYTGLQASNLFFNQTPVFKTLRKKRYEPADDGQARIYDSVFEPIAATFRGERPIFADFRAWLDGRGHPFPDLMATIHGERPLFVHLREWISDLFNAIKECLSLGAAPTEENEELIQEEMNNYNPFASGLTS